MFLDEMGVSLALCPRSGWGKQGEALVQSVPGRRGTNLSVIGALDGLGVIVTAQQLGAMKRVDFERFLSQDLLPRLTEGSVLVLDNATIHKGGQIAELVEQAGCRLLYLPPYSPDFNPIELIWAYVKRLLRTAGPRDDLARETALAEALAAVPDHLSAAGFRHCDYRLPF